MWNIRYNIIMFIIKTFLCIWQLYDTKKIIILFFFFLHINCFTLQHLIIWMVKNALNVRSKVQAQVRIKNKNYSYTKSDQIPFQFDALFNSQLFLFHNNIFHSNTNLNWFKVKTLAYNYFILSWITDTNLILYVTSFIMNKHLRKSEIRIVPTNTIARLKQYLSRRNWDYKRNEGMCAILNLQREMLRSSGQRD